MHPATPVTLWTQPSVCNNPQAAKSTSLLVATSWLCRLSCHWVLPPAVYCGMPSPATAGCDVRLPTLPPKQAHPHLMWVQPPAPNPPIVSSSPAAAAARLLRPRPDCCKVTANLSGATLPAGSALMSSRSTASTICCFSGLLNGG